jgi:hypothetical protein
VTPAIDVTARDMVLLGQAIAQPFAIDGAIQLAEWSLGRADRDFLHPEHQRLGPDPHPALDVARVAVQLVDLPVGLDSLHAPHAKPQASTLLRLLGASRLARQTAAIGGCDPPLTAA